MSARRTTLLVLSLALVAAALSLGTAKASAATITPPSALDPCAYAQADMTESLNDGNQEVWGTIGYWGLTFCGLITDVHVPATALPVPFYLEGGPVSLISSASDCNELTVKILIYKRAEWAADFTRVRSGRLRGWWWNNSTCGLKPISGDVPGALFGTATGVSFATGTGIDGAAVYRIAVSTWRQTPSGATIPLNPMSYVGWSPL